MDHSLSLSLSFSLSLYPPISLPVAASVFQCSVEMDPRSSGKREAPDRVAPRGDRSIGIAIIWEI